MHILVASCSFDCWSSLLLSQNCELVTLYVDFVVRSIDFQELAFVDDLLMRLEVSNFHSKKFASVSVAPFDSISLVIQSNECTLLEQNNIHETLLCLFA